MKIALFGYGKMGRMIEKTATDRGHEITARIDRYEDALSPGPANVAIDFSVPSAAADNIRYCVDAGIPVVCGTTGWADQYPAIKKYVEEKNGTLVHSSNFSVGVNLFFCLNRFLARLTAGYPQYRASICETHHIHKLDAPSGTAITLAEGIEGQNPRYTAWSLAEAGQTPRDGTIGIQAVRQGEIPGIHAVTYTASADSIQIRHEALTREGFAQGAVLAAEWALDKQGVFTMQDVLNIPDF